MKKEFWIAVDEDESVYLFETKPIRRDGQWIVSRANFERIPEFMYEHLNLTWESEPYEIEI